MCQQARPEEFGPMRYYSLNQYYQKQFGEKVYRLSIDGGFTCPNRDGTVGVCGCSFCSAGGSGDFAADRKKKISQQLIQAQKLIQRKTKNCNGFLAYFQAYTNTYADVQTLRDRYMQALEPEYIVGISIATRPDCVSGDVVALLQEISKIKPVYVELGVQTMHDDTLQKVGSGFTYADSEAAIRRLSEAGIPVVVHLILGLPGESRKAMEETVTTVCKLPIHGVKLQLLHVLKGTRLAKEYESHPFWTFELDEYVEFIIDLLELIPKQIVIYRLTGDGPKNLLIAPLWSADKKRVLNRISQRLRERDSGQSKRMEMKE